MMMRTLNLSLLLLIGNAALVQGAGELTMWTTSSSAVTGSSCEYANSAATGSGNTGWLNHYVNAGNTGMYCAVSDDLYNNGVGCGKCYTINYDASDPNTQSTTTSGSATIQVVDSGAGGSEHFDCYITAYQAITGTDTGVYDIGPTGSYTQVDCESSGTYVVMMDGDNAFFTKVLFAGGVTGVSGATLRIGSSSFSMSKVSGATWSANLSGQTNEDVNYDITYDNGSTLTVNCGSTWPVSTSNVCFTSEGANAGSNPSGSSTPAPTAAPTCAECFSSETMVDVLDEGPVLMKDLQVGDLINTGHMIPNDNQQQPLYQPIYAWAHIQPEAMTTFLQIHVKATTRSNGKRQRKMSPLEVSPGHLVFLQGQKNPVRADSIKVGDILESTTASSSTATMTVSKVKHVTRKGLYAPLTQQGTLAVNGIIKTSAYISLQQNVPQYIELQNNMPLKFLSQHDLIHMFLSPFRLVCASKLGKQLLPTTTTDWFCHSYNQDGMPHFVSLGLQLAQTMNGENDDYDNNSGGQEKKSIGLQILVLFLVLIVAGSFTILENLIWKLETNCPTTTTIAATSVSLFLFFTVKFFNNAFQIREKKIKST